ncbi:formyl transferase [Tenacibaculum sp. SZ-18]|uniref:methionyl-tRNA formyltransferase n=1 Tax=Tenacibaculum sp. SZ-18 TaxID=754423 RepID=UPI000CA1ECD0|nr:formyltransferase family protein [Tenacibaculum sp. SZ-18]AUC14163.1 formyl transferase [Tenacibaculum sp. SZ-18]
MKKIKIGYFADGPWSHLAFEKLIKDETIDIKFIVPRSDTKDETLKKFSEKYGIDYLYPVKINDTDFIEKSSSYGCDLFVSMSFNQIFRKQIISVPKLGVINCHAGKLPFYRGRNILSWALINDEKDFGITVHYVDEGIDTGDIIKQNIYPIKEEDNYQTLLNIAYSECANILFDAIKEIQLGTAKRIKQNTIHSVGFYCGRRGVGDEIINWNQTSRELFNFIRSICRPGPISVTFLNGEEVKINCAKMVNEAPSYKGIPGQILSKAKLGYLVKTKDSFIEIFDIETNVKLKVGDRFKNEL